MRVLIDAQLRSNLTYEAMLISEITDQVLVSLK